MPASRDRRVHAAEHTMRLLELIRDMPAGARLTALAEQSGLSKSSVHGLLTTLGELGYVERHGQRYVLGTRLGRLASAGETHSEPLRSAFGPALRAFNELCREACFLSLPGGLHSYLIVDALDAEGRPFIPANDPQRDAITTSAAGKVFIAHDPQLQRRLRRRQGLHAALEQELDQVRQRGYALDLEASRRGLHCVALPLRLRGQVVATLSAGGASHRLGQATMERSASRAMRSLCHLLKA